MRGSRSGASIGLASIPDQFKVLLLLAALQGHLQIRLGLVGVFRRNLDVAALSADIGALGNGAELLVLPLAAAVRLILDIRRFGLDRDDQIAGGNVGEGVRAVRTDGGRVTPAGGVVQENVAGGDRRVLVSDFSRDSSRCIGIAATPTTG